MSNFFTCIALTNPKSPTNVGSVLRACGCFGADQVWYDGSRFDIAKKYSTDTHQANSNIELIKKDSFTQDIPEGTQLVCVDLVEGATPLAEFNHPDKAIYIFGPEDGTITQQVVSQADHVVYIPTLACLNLAATVNVVLYDRSSKLKNIESSDDQIVNSRDRNNKTRVAAL